MQAHVQHVQVSIKAYPNYQELVFDTPDRSADAFIAAWKQTRPYQGSFILRADNVSADWNALQAVGCNPRWAGVTLNGIHHFATVSRVSDSVFCWEPDYAPPGVYC